MKKSRSVVFFVLLGWLASCTKNVETSKENVTSSNKVTSINELKAPSNFNWQMSREVNFSVSVSDPKFQDAIHMISIYDADPLTGGNLLSRGSANLNIAFITKLNLTNTIKQVFIRKTAPDNSKLDQVIDVNSTNISIDLGGIKLGKTNLNKAGSPDCSTGCTQTITSSTSGVSVNNGNVVCVTGNNITVSFNFNGGTLKICGTNVTINNLSFGSTSSLIITSTGSAIFGNLNFNGSFQNWGTARITSSFNSGGTITNNGTIIADDNFNLNSNTNTTNNGTITVGKTLGLSGTLTNNSSITVTDDVNVNGGSLLINNCYLRTIKKYQNNSTTRNYGYIKVDDETTINGGSEVGLYSGAMFRTKDLKLNGMIKGYVSTSLFKVTNDTRINGGASVVNFIQFCDLNGIETNLGTIGSGAAQGCSLYIPTTACNPDGNGSAPIIDADGDGVSDVLDEYPTDASKAYNNYYPSVSGYATLAFEDLWPSRGDYDMNDVVMKYKYNVVTNASNNVAQVIGNYTLLATGGSFQNGFGVEFPITRNKVAGLTGGTLEIGQTNAVVTLFSNSRSEMEAWNTVPSAVTASAKNYTINFTVSAGTSLSSFGLGSYNPFIWNNTVGFGRGYEVHLPRKAPTSLANTALFGSSNDNTTSIPNTYMSKGNNLPWAIDVPVVFNYPIERADITTAHLKFASWVTSGGTQFTEWYNVGTGYRNTAKIY